MTVWNHDIAIDAVKTEVYGEEYSWRWRISHRDGGRRGGKELKGGGEERWGQEGVVGSRGELEDG